MLGVNYMRKRLKYEEEDELSIDFDDDDLDELVENDDIDPDDALFYSGWSHAYDDVAYD